MDGIKSGLWLHLCGHWTLKALQGDDIPFVQSIVPFVQKEYTHPDVTE